MDWTFVLVIILSIFLAIFLVLGIVLLVLLIKVSLQIKKVTTSAEKTAFTIENLVASITRFSSPMLAGKILMKQAKKIKKWKGDR